MWMGWNSLAASLLLSTVTNCNLQWFTLKLIVTFKWNMYEIQKGLKVNQNSAKLPPPPPLKILPQIPGWNRANVKDSRLDVFLLAVINPNRIRWPFWGKNVKHVPPLSARWQNAPSPAFIFPISGHQSPICQPSTSPFSSELFSWVELFLFQSSILVLLKIAFHQSHLHCRSYR